MNPKASFDVLILGAGPAGYVCAIRCAQLGLKVGVIEKEKTLGGTCLNIGCIPSKALLESSHHYIQAKEEFSHHGINFKDLSFDLKTMIGRKQTVVKEITSGVEFLFKKNKITRLEGFGILSSAQTVSITEGKDAGSYQSRFIILATGSEPIELPQAPFDHKQIIDSTDALCLEKVPSHLVVIGGGVIGLELGSVWKRLGAKVSVIEAFDKILGSMDKQLSQMAQRLFTKQGIEFHLGTQLTSCQKTSSGVKVICQSKDGEKTFDADQVLMAVGRRPYTKNIGLERAGVELTERGMIKISEHFETSLKGVFAIGDAVGGAMLAHKAEEEGVALAEHLAGIKAHVNYHCIPSVVYTWPEIASVGQTEEQCKQAGLSYKTGTFHFKANGRAKAMQASEGWIKILADAKTDKMLGVHMIGPMVSELIGEMVLGFEFGASAEDIGRTIHAHPALAEVIKEAALDVNKQAIHA